MRRSNPKKLARQVIGSLKMDYGCKVQVYKSVSETVSWSTGVRTNTNTCVEVDNCIILPAAIKSEVAQSISLISANKPFMMGGYYGTGTRNFIFDFEGRRGLPPTYIWDLSDWIIVDDQASGTVRQYNVEKFEELYFGSGWLVTGVRVQGVVPQRTIKENITDTLQLQLNQVAAFTVSPTATVWLLSGGIWNDLGAWDDTESWED